MNAIAVGREFEFTLPLGYRDDGGRIHRAAVMRKMTGREESILADKRFHRNGGKLVTELLANCLLRLGDLERCDRPVVSSLYSVDRNFLLLKLRSITFGSELQTSYTCPACRQSVAMSEDLDELPVKGLSNGDGPEDIVVQLDEGYVDRDGQVHTALTLRLPTGLDEEAVASQMNQNASLGKNALLARCIESLGEMPRHRVEAIGPKILADLTMTDRRLIDRAINQGAPGVDLVRRIECSNCDNVFNATLDLSHFLALE